MAGIRDTRERDARRRALVAAAALTALMISFIGGVLVLAFPRDAHRTGVALRPIEPAPTTTVTVAPPTVDSSDLSVFGFGGDSSLGAADAAITTTRPGAASDLFAAPGGAAAPAVPALPPVQLPAAPQLPALPETTPIDWNALLAPLAQAQATAQAANVTGSVVGGTAGVLNAGAVALGDAILLAVYANNGQNFLSSLQSALDAPAAASAIAALNLPAPPDLTGLTEAFAAAAAAPPLGVPALPQLPALTPPPGLPNPDDLAAGLAGLSALGALGLPGMPGLPPPPNLPRPEDVVGGIAGGIVAAAVAGAVLGAVFQPPSLTRLMGLPF